MAAPPPDRARSASGDDGWGPSTAVRAGAAPRPGVKPPVRSAPRPDASRRPAADGWTPAGPAPRAQQRATQAADRRTEKSLRDLENRRTGRPEARAVLERGLPWWGAMLVLIAIALVGGIIDTVGSISVRGGFNIGIVVASIVAILIVKRSHMFPIVISPPIVYSLAAVSQLYLRSNGLANKKVVFDAAANYLVYGFPAIAAASAAVLIIAGIRLITRR